MDKASLISSDLAKALETKSAAGDDFEHFRVYQWIPRTESVTFPCMVLSVTDQGTFQEFLGGGRIDYAQVTIQLAFQEKSGKSTEAEDLEHERLLQHYREKMDDFYYAMKEDLGSVLDPTLEVVSLENLYEYKYPKGADDTIWGLSYKVTIYYYDE